MGQFSFILINAGIILFALVCIGFILARLYKRSSKEVSFVRTGFRGQKVILNGGAVVLPVLHEIIPVNMNTLRLEVKRENQQALITRDRMRVDVAAEFYVRVKPTEESIANAAQTLGMKTMVPAELKELVEGKFVDSLRAVAAEMAMEELHEQRVEFVTKVQAAVSEDLLKNGLELESVSLTGMDQTSKEHFNPDNAFDAEGLTKLTQEIEERRKIRNDIELDTQVAIDNKNLEARRQQLDILKEREYAELAQERELEIRRASQAAEIAEEKAKKHKEAQQATIDAEKQINQSKIAAAQAIESDNIAKAQLINEKEILKNQTLELAEQDKAIALAEKSKAKSLSEAEADKARANAIREAERVITVQETEKAERIKSVELVEARQVAEKQAISVQVAAEAEKLAAMDRAEAVKTLANAEADKKKIEAGAEAEAEKLRAEAAEISYRVEAEGAQALNAAKNLLSSEQIAMQVRLELIKQLPEIIRQSVKPMEQIEGIKIIQVDGLTNGQGSTSAENNTSASLGDQLVNSALRYRGQAPLVDSLLADIGLKGSDLNGLTEVFHQQAPPATDARED